MIEMSGDPNNLIPTTYIPTTSTGNVGYMVMSYPGRPPMVPGIPMPPGMGMPYMPLGGPPPMIPTVMPMAHPHMMAGPPMTAMPGPLRPFRPHNSQQQRQQNRPRPALVPQIVSGPTVTVFVGNITDKAPDQMIRHILAACGTVLSWKRVQAFGFCEYGNPDAGLRAIRILHEMEIGGKKLVAKVDAKTKSVLDEYKAEKRKKIKGRSPLQDEPEEPDDYIDEDMKKSDEAAKVRILAILDDYQQDMKNYSASTESERRTQRTVTDRLALLTQASEASVRDADGPIDLDDANIEEGKRDLITREIGKFREIMKKQEEEKEVERKRREEKERERRENDSPISNGRDRDSRSRARSQDSRISRSSSRSITPDRRSHHKSSRHRTRSRSRDRDRDRERERERERERDRDREKERDRERDRDTRDDKKSERDLLREKEEEEEAKERRKQERKAREKEAAYQERLRTWESRERHKAKELAKEREKKRLKEEEREREAKRLKEFLEDYDDERDDIKYYKGRELQKRLEEREKEMEIDARDRQKEKEELEELRAKIFNNSESGDPNVEFAKALQEREEMYKPKLVINVNAEHAKLREKEREKEQEKIKEKEREKERERERELAARERQKEEAELEELRRRAVALAEAQQEAERALQESEQVDTSPARSDPPPSPEPMPVPEPKPAVKPWSSPVVEKEKDKDKDKKKKKLDVKEVFNNDDEDDSNVGVKKRKLVPLDYGDEKKKGKEEKKEESSGRSQEEKRKHIKTLIDKIPTDKNALFAFQLDWAAVDNQLMERRIRPWINKKIIEYIGEPEPTLVDFICSKVLAGSAPQGILDDVQMVLDEEAEVFVVKMWRLLIYEIEAKKLGLVK